MSMLYPLPPPCPEHLRLRPAVVTCENCDTMVYVRTGFRANFYAWNHWRILGHGVAWVAM